MLVLRVAIAIVLCGLVVLYTVGVVLGLIPENRRIDAANLAMIALAIGALCSC